MSSIYRVSGEHVETGTEAGGPWDPGVQHGAAPAALMVWALDRCASDGPMRLARMTISLLRPVPVGPLRMTTNVRRSGRKVQVIDVTLSADGIEVARLEGVKVRVSNSDVDSNLIERPLDHPPPEQSFKILGGPRIVCPFLAGVSSRLTDSPTRRLGPNSMWLRLDRSIVEDEPNTPAMLAAVAGDFCNGVSSPLDFAGWTFINADMSITLRGCRAASGFSSTRKHGSALTAPVPRSQGLQTSAVTSAVPARRSLSKNEQELNFQLDEETDMKAYEIKSFDGVESVRLVERPSPTPGPGQVLIKIRACSLNYRDLLILGRQYPLPGRIGVVPLNDGAGDIVAVGPNVSRVAAGARVCPTYFPRWLDGQIRPEWGMDQFGCTRDGTLAEFVLCEEDAVVEIPAHLTYEEAAALPCAGVTAWSALNGPKRVVPGATVLTIGTGGVALFALQFAKLFGARVFSLTTRKEKIALLKGMGAENVICTSDTPDWHVKIRELTNGRGVDHVIETGNLETLPKSLLTCAWNADVALVLALTGGSIDVGAMRGLYTARRLFVGSRADFETMMRAVATHKVKPTIGSVFAFEEARDAYKLFAEKSHTGKIIIRGTS